MMENISRSDDNFSSIKFVWRSMSEDRSIEENYVFLSVDVCVGLWLNQKTLCSGQKLVSADLITTLQHFDESFL
jgi:hypothetical protein